jgi:hypothetical protein
VGVRPCSTVDEVLDPYLEPTTSSYRVVILRIHRWPEQWRTVVSVQLWFAPAYRLVGLRSGLAPGLRAELPAAISLEAGHPVTDVLHVCLHEKQRLKVSYEDERCNGS